MSGTPHILAIDDSLTIREMIGATLRGAGYEVTTADDGAAGVDAFDAGQFDAVITDINMPKLDGFGVVEAIRAQGGTKVPILVLTTESGPTLKDRARQVGATGWIVKPIDDEALVTVLDRVTGRR